MTRKELLEMRDQALFRTHKLRSIRQVALTDELPKVLTCLCENHLAFASMANRIKNFVIVEPKPNPALFFQKTLYQSLMGNKQLRWETEPVSKHLTPDKWQKITTRQFYVRPRTLGLSWGAYLLPDDVEIGDRVYVSELIEDVQLVGNTLAADGIAVWTGDGLVFEEEHWEELRKVKYWVVG